MNQVNAWINEAQEVATPLAPTVGMTVYTSADAAAEEAQEAAAWADVWTVYEDSLAEGEIDAMIMAQRAETAWLAALAEIEELVAAIAMIDAMIAQEAP